MDDKNVAKAYHTLDDTSPVEILTGKTFSGSAAGFRSCTKDLLTFYDAFMVAFKTKLQLGTHLRLVLLLLEVGFSNDVSSNCDE